MNLIDIVGLLAGLFTSSSFVPQVLKIWRTRETEALSFNMYFLLSIGFVLWIFFGIKTCSLPIVLTNSFTLILSLSILFLKRKNERAQLKSETPASSTK